MSSGRLERLGAVRRVQHELARVRARVQLGEPLELRAVLPVEAHHLVRGEHPPEVGLRVVPQPGEQPVGARVLVGGGVEEELRVARVVVPVGAEHLLEVADAHVVRDHREVLAAELVLGELQVATRGRERLPRVEALVHPAPLCPDAIGLARPARGREPPGEPLACAHVDLHVEQVRARLGEDLREPDGSLEVVARAGVRAAGALQQHHALDQIGIDAGVVCGLLDVVAEGGHAARRGEHAARALRVHHVAVPGRGAPLELVLASAARTRTGRPRSRAGCSSAGRRRGAAGSRRGGAGEQHEEDQATACVHAASGCQGTQGAPSQTSITLPPTRRNSDFCRRAAGAVARRAVRVLALARGRVRGGRRRDAGVPQDHRRAAERERVEVRDPEVRVHVGVAPGRERRPAHRRSDRARLHLGGHVGHLVVARTPRASARRAPGCPEAGRRVMWWA